MYEIERKGGLIVVLNIATTIVFGVSSYFALQRVMNAQWEKKKQAHVDTKKSE